MGRYCLYMQEKPCINCGKKFEDTKENFVTRNGKTLNQCKLCRHQQKQRLAAKKKSQRDLALNRVEGKGLDIYSALAATGGSNIPHTAEVVEQVITYFGGVSGFSAMLVKQFYDSEPGSSVRNKLLETICRLVQSNVDSGGAKKPLDLWTEEELEDELNARFAALSGGFSIDAEATPPEALSSQATHNIELDDAAEERDAESDERTEGEETGGSEAIQADPSAAEDT